jgi:hypothetical protein
MRYSWLDLLVYLLAVVCLIPLVMHMGEVFLSVLHGNG